MALTLISTVPILDFNVDVLLVTDHFSDPLFITNTTVSALTNYYGIT